VSFTTSSLPAGSHAITAVYSGDVNFITSMAGLTAKITRSSTTVMVHSSIGTSVHGATVTFTATVSAGLPGSLTPAGTVSFYDGKTLLGRVALPADGSGQVSFTTSAALAGHSNTVVYSGDHDLTGSSVTLAPAKHAVAKKTDDSMGDPGMSE
jgi:hypothetical protein